MSRFGSKVKQTHISFTLVGTEYLTVNIYSTWKRYEGEQDNNEGFCGHFPSLWVFPKGLEKGITLTFQRYVILVAKRQ